MEQEEKEEEGGGVKQASYEAIVKSSFLMGFVQVCNILVKVGLNKIVAVFLGTAGVGVMALYQSAVNILKTGCDLGLSQSAVRDIAVVGKDGPDALGRVVAITKRMILWVGLLGIFVTVALSAQLSRWSFGNENYTISFLWISLVVFFNVIYGGQMAILRGVRQFKALAKASLFSSILGLVLTTPLYYFFRMKAIIPSLLITALITVVCFEYYVRKIDYVRQTVGFKSTLREGSLMIKMGIALMYVNFLGVIADYIIRGYLSNVGSVETVGLFQAGATIITSYFGIVLTSLAMDYYPRISLICDDNKRIEGEFNRQCEAGFLLVGPLIVIFLFAMPFFIRFLYSNAFLPAMQFLELAMFYSLMTICSNSMEIILLAKRAVSVFFFTSTFTRVIMVGISMFMFSRWGLKGLGAAYVISGALHWLLMGIVIGVNYHIRMKRGLIQTIIVVFAGALLAFFLKEIEVEWVKYLCGVMLLTVSVGYSLYIGRKEMGIDVVRWVLDRLKKR